MMMKSMALLLVVAGGCGGGGGGSAGPPEEKEGAYSAGVSFLNGAVQMGDGEPIAGTCTAEEVALGECLGRWLVYCDDESQPRAIDCDAIGSGFRCAGTIEGLDCVP